jgi:hypothetical protein
MFSTKGNIPSIMSILGTVVEFTLGPPYPSPMESPSIDPSGDLRNQAILGKSIQRSVIEIHEFSDGAALPKNLT